MLKLLFWFLLLANGALFAYRGGYLDKLFPDGHEPERIAKQLNANQIKLVPASVATAPPVVVPPPVIACTEIGNFDPAEAKLFETKLAPLSLGDKLTRRNVPEGGQSMVFIPSQGSKEGADKKAGELRARGVKDFFVIQEGTELRWGISLGIFSTEQAARTYLATLNQHGVHSARIGPYKATSSKIAFQLRQLDEGLKGSVDKIKADFPHQEMRACEGA